MINQGQPLLEEGKFDTMGTPFHGLFQNGGLDLPNGTRKTFPTTRPNPNTSEDDPCPVDVGGHRPGDVSTTRIPGHALVRELENIAGDAAKGHQWLDYAVIAGSKRYTYGAKLGPRTWLYCVPGEVWQITMAHQAVSGFLSFEVKRFGQIGATELQEKTLQVPFPSASTVGVTQERFGVMFLELCGHSESGAKAAIGLGLTLANANPHDRQAPYPEAFFTVTVTGTGSVDAIGISVALYKSASQCVQYELLKDNATIDTRASESATPTLLFTNYQYDANGWTRRTLVGTYYYPGTTRPPAEASPFGSLPSYQELFFSTQAANQTGERSNVTEKISRRTIWVFVDAAGVFTDVGAELYYKYSQVIERFVSAFVTTDAAGFDTNSSTGGTVRNPSGVFVNEVTRFAGTEAILELRLMMGGAQVDKWSAMQKMGKDTITHQETVLAANSLTLNSVGTVNNNSTAEEPADAYEIGGNSVTSAFVSSKCAPNPDEAIMGHALNFYVSDGDGMWYWPYVHLYTNKLVGLVEGHTPEKTVALGGFYSSVYLTTAGDIPVKYGPIHSPGGTVFGGGTGNAYDRFCSWQPVTGAFSGLHATPVVYL